MQVDTQIQLLNKQAMDELRYENYSESVKLLSRAQDLLSKITSKNIYKLQAITYNNLGCFYKTTGKNELALKYLHSALVIEKAPDFDPSNLAGTHLNISAIYSQTGDHNPALTHAITALKLLKGACSDNSIKNITTLIIALHNTGIEYEFIGNIEKAAATFKYGLELAQEYLGNKHHFTTALLKSFLAITTTEKKYYFEKSKKRLQSSNAKTMKSAVVGLPKMGKYTGQEFVPAHKNLPKKKKEVENNEKKNKKFRTLTQTADELVERQELPMIEKPKTFGGRLKRSPHSEYVSALEEKINFLQSQLVGFEKRYKELEVITETKQKRRFSQNDADLKHQKKSKDWIIRDKAAICIQKYWKGFLARNELTRRQEIQKRKRIEKDLKQLESLKKQVLQDRLKENNKKALGSGSERTSEALKKYSLPPIAETKFETKSQKAILIQSHVRMYLQRKKFKLLQSAVLKIQSHIKKSNCKTLFSKILLAIKFIQRFWRKYRAHKAIRNKQ